MSLIAVILLIVSAATHAGWNLLAKKEQASAGFFMAVYYWALASAYKSGDMSKGRPSTVEMAVRTSLTFQP